MSSFLSLSPMRMNEWERPVLYLVFESLVSSDGKFIYRLVFINKNHLILAKNLRLRVA